MSHLCYKCMLHCICTKYVCITFPASSKAHTIQHMATSYSSLLTASSPRSVHLCTSGRVREESGMNHQIVLLVTYNCATMPP